MDVPPSLRVLTERETAREELILHTAEHLIARFGAAAVTFARLANAIKIYPTTMRRHFTDVDALLGELMRRHLHAISQAIGAVPRDAPDRRRLQRAAYIKATRILGAPTKDHLILTTYSTILAENEPETIDEIRNVIATTLNPENPQGALNLLDDPNWDIDQIKTISLVAR